MTITIDLNQAVRQMRVARHLGKINNEVQSRVMRRLAPREEVLQWESMMALRANIEKEILPVLTAKRNQDDIQTRPAHRYTRFFSESEVLEYTGKKLAAPKLTGHDYTPEWWAAAEVRERAARKTGLAV